ncbi:MAG TPA: DUF547 domain-containing protein [Vicinamibacteria bacterium]|nr:DUF547 domain-containing protein [Vicinamibacteria bacterium]
MLALTLAASLSFDHSAFDALLKKHVTPAGLVDYDAFGRAPEFKRYLKDLAAARPDALPPREQLALWINAYNAYTIELVNAHGERESIRNINKTLGVYRGKGPWQEPIARVGGRALTLDEIEHGIIRKRFAEPRIHFALVCAAMGCPELRREAYTGERLSAQLDDQARAFILRSPRRNRVDVAARTVHVSPIFTWYREDFGGDDAAIGRYLARYFPPGPEQQLLAGGRFTLETTEYDWSLNRPR